MEWDICLVGGSPVGQQKPQETNPIKIVYLVEIATQPAIILTTTSIPQ
jgi:hypothetical protein